MINQMKTEKKDKDRIVVETKECSYESLLFDENKLNELLSKQNRTTVYLKDHEIAIAKKIGCGKISNGIRKALDVFYKKHKKDI